MPEPEKQDRRESGRVEEPDNPLKWAFKGKWPVPLVVVLLAITALLQMSDLIEGGVAALLPFAGAMAYWLVRKPVQEWWQRRKLERMTATERLRAQAEQLRAPEPPGPIAPK